MLNVARLFRSYRETGALNEHVALWGFLDERAFLTKRGDVGLVLRVTGIDWESFEPDEIDILTKRFEAALRLLDSNYRVYQYFFRQNDPEIPESHHADAIVAAAVGQRVAHLRAKADGLYASELYYVVLHQGPGYQGGFAKILASLSHPAEAWEQLRAQFATSAQTALLTREIDRARYLLGQRVAAVVIQLADFLPAETLTKDEAFRFFRRLLNPDPAQQVVGRKYDTHLDYYVCGSQLTIANDHLALGDYYVRVLTLREPTALSRPLLLKKLYELPLSYHLVSEWRAIPGEEARKLIATARRHHHSQKTSVVGHMSDGGHPAELLVDQSKDSLVADLSEALVELDRGGQMGEYTFTAVLYDRDRERVEAGVGELFKAFAVADGSLYEETYNQANAFFATIPGGRPFNFRRLLLSDANHADYSFLWRLSEGSRTSAHLRGEYLALFETQHSGLYYYTLHHQDLGHTLVLGRTGSGKSFLLSYLATNFQKYAGFTFLFELGGSFEGFARLFGGTYYRIGSANAETGFKINPFALEPTTDNLSFLYSFTHILIEGDEQYRLTTLDERELHAAILSLYQLDRGLRTLGNLANLLPKQLADQLQKWVHGTPDGAYSNLFDNHEDTLELARVQAFDFEGLERHPEVLEPLLFYILHRANALIYDPANVRLPKLFILDEAWRFFRNPVLKAYIVEALKTWRKKNGAMVLATQSVADLKGVDLVDILVESCPTKILLANPDLDEAQYRRTFNLRPSHIEAVKALAPKRQLLLVRPDEAKVLTLDVDPKSYWLYTNDPNDNARRDEVMARHGFERGLEILAQGDRPSFTEGEAR